MKVLIMDVDDVMLLRILLHRHRDLTISKINFYEFLERNGEYHSSLKGYKKLKNRYDRLLEKLNYKEKVVCCIK